MEDLVLLRKKVELAQKRVQLQQSFGLMFYKPHKKQKEFHEAAHFRFRLLRCGNRFGKSDSGVGEDLAFALGERPWLDKDDPMRYHGIPKHPTKGLVVAADDDKVDEIFTGDGRKGHVGKIWKKIPKDLIIGTPKRSSSGTITSMRIKGLYGESVIDFDTRAAFKNNPMGAESSDYDWCHVDEPIEEAHWKAILRGLTDRAGKAWFTCTLLEQPWISDFFFEDVKFQRQEQYEFFSETGRPVKWVMTGSIYDNPYLSQEAIEDFLNTLTEEERACRISGLPLYLAGLVYKEFQHEKHVMQELPPGWKAYDSPPLDYTIDFSIDPHPRTPHAVLFAATSKKGKSYIYDEIFMNGTAESLAKEILPRLVGRNVNTRIMDPSAFVEDQRNKSVFASDLLQHGVFGVEKAPKDLNRGITATKQAWVAGDLKVSPLCRTFLWEIGRYAWADKNGVPVNKPVDKDDHMMENLYRLVLRGLNYVDPGKYSDRVDEEEISAFNPRDDSYGNLSLNV